MRSTWIEHQGKKIFYQDFSKLFYNSEAVKAELALVQEIVKTQPNDSALVLTDMRDTNVGSDLLPAMNDASRATKAHVHKTAVLGVVGIKRKLADLLTAMTGQPLKYFDDIESAKDWLAKD
ncbi:MAG: STAS/SEC14 domain-containing protein [Anaerolineales bacterium]|nr:MAG: STAS/SEC14 domain-containing protein [Anaerolineales bacterium]